MSRDDVEIRAYRPGDEHRILETFNLVFREVCGAGYVDRTMAHWAWQYLHNPVGHRISLAIAKDGTVASQYAGVPMLADTPWGPQRFVHAVDSMTHPAFRQGLQKQALFLQVGADYAAQCLVVGEAMCFGFPVDMAYRIGQRYLQYHLLGTVDYLVRDRSLPPPVADATIRCERSTRLPLDLDPLWAKVRADKQCLIRRDHRFLQWRYIDHPDANHYEVWTARRGDALLGLCVLRADQGLVPDALAIVDWLVPENDAAAAAALLAAATRRQHELGKLRLFTVLAPWSAETRTFVQHGFVPTPSATWLQRRLVHGIHLQGMTPSYLAQHWWYMLGDTDLA
ncbi:MAG: hypothetical protein JNK15_21810 [Planctomycetes bacterium]|nr:hypothetical protein [Planctomycetota bacterium]